MLIDIHHLRYCGSDTYAHHHEFSLVDSEFGTVVCGATETHMSPTNLGGGSAAGAIIMQYSKRNLNVARNLLRLLFIYQERYNWIMTNQIAWWQKFQPLFTQQLKLELDKYIALM